MAQEAGADTVSAPEHLVFLKPLCLTVRQPWATLIVEGFKDIENRRWAVPQFWWDCGKLMEQEILIHAARMPSKIQLQLDICYMYEFAYKRLRSAATIKVYERFIERKDLQFGGIIGKATITNCVTKSESPWFEGPYGFVLKDAKTLPFFPCRGMLGFWKLKEANRFHAPSPPPP